MDSYNGYIHVILRGDSVRVHSTHLSLIHQACPTLSYLYHRRRVGVHGQSVPDVHRQLSLPLSRTTPEHCPREVLRQLDQALLHSDPNQLWK